MWVKTEASGCILFIVIGGFTIAGGIILFLGLTGHSTVDSSVMGNPVLETVILGVFFISCPWVGFGILNIWVRRQNSRSEGILADGILKKAIIRSFEETGTCINDAPKIRFQLEIEETDGSTRVEEVSEIVSILDAVRLKPGLAVTVHESPEGIIIHFP